MLDNITKKNIDDCRDVLVGKVPDPKSQIEQITLALIYKFMDDMDKEAVEKFKGKAKFFTGEYDKYGWRKLFDPSLSGQDMLALYSEALEKLNTNPNIPELFRNIFKNAYLPYRDPSTLKLFLKYINEFEYSHSEKLGDAFEYLLSVMGSQGDAGQFRTPRHIIDFVTACVNPQKNETVLDPACGTAGFLLSAYKHILYQNTIESTAFGHVTRLGNGLTPNDRKKLATNFVGYDISPDMVRLSLANMYLHGFATPQIHEYDSLSSEDRWQETFDVVLANPPFMTPKGGIRPHKKFGVQANKAEVLFTDYIAEHLNSNGRAGIVVPNGIVATSQTAYKQLRKMLVQDSLIAVISLPAGVFQPYSGVKTSVLILDKRLAKKSQHILFLKIENDGFDLGAQRREIDKNDLPVALAFLETYKNCLNQDGQDLQDIQDLQIAYEKNPANPTIDKILLQTIATLVEKETVLGNKDVVLSGDRYSHINKLVSSFDLVQLKDICEVTSSKRIYQDEYVSDGIPFYRTKEVSELDKGKIISLELFISRKRYEEIKKNFSVPQKGDILISAVGTIGATWVIPDDREFYFKDGNLIWLKNITGADPNYLKQILEIYFSENVKDISGGAAYSALTIVRLKEIEIPLPPLAIQQQIVAEIEGYQKIIDGAKQVVKNYKPTISINPDWEMVELGEVCEIKSGGTPNRDTKGFWENGTIPWVKTGEINYGLIDNAEEKITQLGMQNSSAKLIPKGTILMAMYGQGVTRGRVAKLGIDATINQACAAFLIKDKKTLNTNYLFYTLQNMYQQIRLRSDGHGGNQSNLSATIIKEFQIPLPSLSEQQTIVKAIEEELQLVNANKRLIEIFEQKIKTKIGEVWGVKEEEALSMAAEPLTEYNK